MSDFTVLRSLDGYCLVLDKKRIAGDKPDYRGQNVLVDWTTEVAYGPVDDLAAENAKLRELVARLICHIENPPCDSCMAEMPCAGGEGLTNCDEYQFMVRDARKLGIEVDE